MKTQKSNSKQFNESLVIVFTSIILAISISLADLKQIPAFTGIFLIVITLNIITKKLTARYYNAELKTKFWYLQRYGFEKKAKFKNPIPMIWFPFAIAIISDTRLSWLAITISDIKKKITRVTRKHKFIEISEFQTSLIIASGIIANIILATLIYLIMILTNTNSIILQSLININLYYAFWSLIPLSNLDGMKIIIGSRKLWAILTILILSTISYFLIIFP
jgi:hypothetical protein